MKLTVSVLTLVLLALAVTVTSATLQVVNVHPPRRVFAVGLAPIRVHHHHVGFAPYPAYPYPVAAYPHQAIRYPLHYPYPVYRPVGFYGK